MVQYNSCDLESVKSYDKLSDFTDYVIIAFFSSRHSHAPSKLGSIIKFASILTCLGTVVMP